MLVSIYHMLVTRRPKFLPLLLLEHFLRRTTILVKDKETVTDTAKVPKYRVAH